MKYLTSPTPKWLVKGFFRESVREVNWRAIFFTIAAFIVYFAVVVKLIGPMATN